MLIVSHGIVLVDGSDSHSDRGSHTRDDFEDVYAMVYAGLQVQKGDEEGVWYGSKKELEEVVLARGGNRGWRPQKTEA